jgi:hypothetical protein
MNILSVGTELFHAGGQTERHSKANNHLPKFCECVCVKRWRSSEANISQTKAPDATKYHYQYSYGHYGFRNMEK